MDVSMSDASQSDLHPVAPSLAPEVEALAAVAAEVSAHGHDHHDHHDHHNHQHHHYHHHHHLDHAIATSHVMSDDADQPHMSMASTGTAGGGGSGGQKERNSLTLNQRRALRRWANSQVTRPSHKMCQEWFEREFGQTISQSTVSHSLSPKYSRLDMEAPQLSGSRLRFGNWPDVEKLVLKWYQTVLANGRHPTNEELAEKAKNVFTALPQYRDEPAPEFSPGWIHRFKKRYGLLIRRQRRHGDVENAAEDAGYLTECLQRYSGGNLTQETSPVTVRELIARTVGVEPSLHMCALVRDEVLRKVAMGQDGGMPSLSIAAVSAAESEAAAAQSDGLAATAIAAVAAAQSAAEQPAAIPSTVLPISLSAVPSVSTAASVANNAPQLYHDDDPEMVLQKALRQLQADEAAAEANAAVVREEHKRVEALRQGVLGNLVNTVKMAEQQQQAEQARQAAAQQQQQQQQHIDSSSDRPPPHPQSHPSTTQPPHQPSPTPTSTPTPSVSVSVSPPVSVPVSVPIHGHSRFVVDDDLTLTPIDSAAPTSERDRPVRCPFCVNQRMLRTIKEAVEHLSTHVEV